LKKLFFNASTVTALVATAALAGQVPRPAPDFTASLPGGNQLRLSDYRGKVVCLEFLFTTCPHCQHASQLMNNLQAEYGPRGFQALGVAFNDMSNMLVPDFIRDFKISYPVGWSPREPVIAFLQNNPDYALHVPQIVMIDKSGTIRVQSQAQGDATTATEANLRKHIEELLKEPGPPASKKSTTPVRKRS